MGRDMQKKGRRSREELCRKTGREGKGFSEKTGREGKGYKEKTGREGKGYSEKTGIEGLFRKRQEEKGRVERLEEVTKRKVNN